METRLSSFLNISKNFLHDIVLHWWYFEGKKVLWFSFLTSHAGKEQYKRHLHNLRQQSGSCLRVDHTYKITSTIRVKVKGKWVSHYYCYDYDSAIVALNLIIIGKIEIQLVGYPERRRRSTIHKDCAFRCKRICS
jgi:hypothetical protein